MEYKYPSRLNAQIFVKELNKEKGAKNNMRSLGEDIPKYVRIRQLENKVRELEKLIEFYRKKLLRVESRRSGKFKWN